MNLSKGIWVLGVVASKENHAALQEILGGAAWNLRRAGTCHEASLSLRERTAPVVICEKELPDGDWKTMLAKMAQLAYRPRLIVTSRVADNEFWADVLHHGGYDLLAEPLRAPEVLWVVRSAWDTWRQEQKKEHAAATAGLQGRR
jgi:DNA-binding NtrC family response regulator